MRRSQDRFLSAPPSFARNPELFRGSERRMVPSGALAKEGRLWQNVPSYGWQANFTFQRLLQIVKQGLMFYAYVLQSLTDPTQFYRGHTSDLRQRLTDHNGGRCPHT